MGIPIAKCPACPTHFQVNTILTTDECPECDADWSDAEIAAGGED